MIANNMTNEAFETSFLDTDAEVDLTSFFSWEKNCYLTIFLKVCWRGKWIKPSTSWTDPPIEH